MSDHTELDKASVEKFYRSACATLHDLEARLIEARAIELFWRRALRRTVFSELVSQYGGEAPDAQPNEDDRDVGGPLVPVESDGGAGDGYGGGDAAGEGRGGWSQQGRPEE